MFCLIDLVYKVSRKKQIQTTTVVVLLLVVILAASEQEKKNTVGQLAWKKKFWNERRILVMGQKEKRMTLCYSYKHK